MYFGELYYIIGLFTDIGEYSSDFGYRRRQLESILGCPDEGQCSPISV